MHFMWPNTSYQSPFSRTSESHKWAIFNGTKFGFLDFV